MLGPADLIAFVGTTDLDRAASFYAGTLGLTLVDRNDFACVFDVNGTMLRVTAVPSLVPAGYTVLGWRVPDIAAAIHSLSVAGVQFTRYDGMGQDDDGVWTTPGGDKIAWFTDPDGNVLSLTQFT